MKKSAGIILSVVACLAIAVSGAVAADIPFSGFLGEPGVYEKMVPGPEGGAKLRWVKPDADYKKYKRFMVDSVIFYLSDNNAYKGFDPQEMKDLADAFNTELAAAFRNKWPMVSEPGPDVARIRIAITNLKPSNPARSVVSTILPIGMAISLVKKGAAGGWTGSGETGIEVVCQDSVTNEPFLMAVDQRKAAFEKRFSKWDSAKEAFRFWAERTVYLIDEAQGVKREPAN